MDENTAFNIAFLGITLYTSLLVSLLLVPLSNRLAFYLNILDFPDSRKIHAAPIPRLGGLAIAMALVIAIILCVKMALPVQAFLWGSVLVILTGLADDKFHLSPKIKFIGEILAVSVFMIIGGFKLQSFGNVLGIGSLDLGSLAPVITVFCMVGVMNALNLSDGLDGLASGIGVIAALFLAVIAFVHQAWYWADISLILLGVLLGFLRFNHFPAKLFMGDTGSLLIGYTLAAVTVGLVNPEEGAIAVRPITMAIILGLPVADTLWVMSRRILAGQSPVEPDKTHLHHRLLKMGIGHGGVVTIVYGLMLLFGIWSWLVRGWPEWWQFYSTLGLFIFLYGSLVHFERRHKDLGQMFRAARLIKPRQTRLLGKKAGKLFHRFSAFIFLMLIVPVFFIPPAPRLLGLLSFAAALFIFMLYPWRAGKEKLLMAHGLVYASCFFLLLLYLLSPATPSWVTPFLYLASFLAFCWVLIKVIVGREDPLLYPAGFEVLLMLFSWFIPIVLVPALDLGADFQQKVILACVQTVPFLCLLKLVIRRDLRRNRGLALGFIFIFLAIGGVAFL